MVARAYYWREGHTLLTSSYGNSRTGLYSIGGPDARTSPDNKTVGWGAVNMVGYAGGLDYHNAGIEGVKLILSLGKRFAHSAFTGDGSSSRLDLWNGDDKTMNMGLWEKVTKIAEEKYDGASEHDLVRLLS